MWVGDNIQDFPGLSQESRGTAAALAAFGSRFILIPEPHVRVVGARAPQLTRTMRDKV